MMKKVNIDATDLRILSVIQQNGQISKSKLAEYVNLSPTPCWIRLNKLKTAGFIRGYRADISLELIGDYSQIVVPLSLNQHRKVDFDRFEKHINCIDEITECIATGGGMDYILTFVCPSLKSFQTLIDELLEAEIGIDRYMTYFATRIVKSAQPNLAKIAQDNN